MGFTTTLATATAPLQQLPQQDAFFEFLQGAGVGLQASFIVNIALAGLAIVAFAFMTRSLSDPRSKLIAVSTILVPVVSIASYTGLASGLTLTVLDNPLHNLHVVELANGDTGTVIPWGRYLTWGFSTPFILIAIGLIAGSNITKLFTAVTFDIAMILTGLAAALITSSAIFRMAFYAWSSIYFLVVIYILLVSWPKDAQAAGTVEIFNTLKLLTVISWFGYPVVWIAGAEGFGALDSVVTSWAYSVLDIVAKYLFGFLLLNYVRKEPESVTSEGDYGASLPGVTPADD